MVQATSSPSYMSDVQQSPMVVISQEDKTASASPQGETDLKEAEPDTPVVPVEETRPVLSDEQQRVVDLALAGKSLFFTGSAGLLRPFFRIFFLTYYFQELANPSPSRNSSMYCAIGTKITNIAMYLLLLALVSAWDLLGFIVKQLQGIASVAIGGTTLHSWAGIGLGKGPVDDLRWKVLSKIDAKKRCETTDVLVIDESKLTRSSRCMPGI